MGIPSCNQGSPCIARMRQALRTSSGDADKAGAVVEKPEEEFGTVGPKRKATVPWG